MAKQDLSEAKANKRDEWYTQLTDIEAELHHYRPQFKGKTVYCNCDDPYESNFFKYFATNFNAFGLNRLLATSYAGSPIVGERLPLDDIEGLKPDGREPYMIDIRQVPDHDNKGAVDFSDVDALLRNDYNAAKTLAGGGVFPQQRMYKPVGAGRYCCN